MCFASHRGFASYFATAVVVVACCIVVERIAVEAAVVVAERAAAEIVGHIRLEVNSRVHRKVFEALRDTAVLVVEPECLEGRPGSGIDIGGCSHNSGHPGMADRVDKT